jgi:ParB family chromosome partitioning protein
MPKIKISEIRINQFRRRADFSKVEELAQSMREIGLLNPITVSRDNSLIAGLHRIEAVKLLGWEEIDANIVDVDGLRAELAEIDENLMRNELHYIDRGRQLARRKEIYEELHPETKARNVRGHASNYKSSSAESALEDAKPSFVSDVSSKTGISTRTVHVELQIAKNVLPEVQEIIKEKDIPKTEALRLARMEPEKQKKIAEKISNGETRRCGVLEIERSIKTRENKTPMLKNTFQGVEVRKGDFREVLDDIPNESVDIVFTDPPYGKQYLPLWEDLAEFAARKLKKTDFSYLTRGRCICLKFCRLCASI